MATILNQIFSSRELVLPTDRELAALQNDKKLVIQISHIVALCLRQQPQMNLEETLEEVLQILQPGINRRARVKRLSKVIYEHLIQSHRITEELIQRLSA